MEHKVITWHEIQIKAEEYATLLDQHGSNTDRCVLVPCSEGAIHFATAIKNACTQETIVYQEGHTVAAASDLVVGVSLFEDQHEKRRLLFEEDYSVCISFLSISKQQKMNVDKESPCLFPWQIGFESSTEEDAVKQLIRFIGDNPDREGLLETPKRVAAAYKELFAGYTESPEDHIKTFEAGQYDAIVLVRDVEFVSFCEHHMLPFSGTAHIAYLPNEKVIGVSKLGRILDVYAKRLQIQERLTQQVVNALDQYLAPKGAACIIKAKHQCMSCRGVKKQNSLMVTSSLSGAFFTEETRQELYAMIAMQ